MDYNYVIQILKENYRTVEQTQSLRDWFVASVEAVPHNDFYFLFGENYDERLGLTEAQQKEYEKLLLMLDDDTDPC
jgi:hypothetical protein